MANREFSMTRRAAAKAFGCAAVFTGTASAAAPPRRVPKLGLPIGRDGDEIVAAGQFFHTTAPVVTWMDPGGYDAYRVERRFAPIGDAGWEKSKGQDMKSPNRYGMRTKTLAPDVVDRVRGGGWDLATLQTVIDQFVIHYDVCGTSKTCFKVLHDQRGLSVHFMLDLDGTIYQTLDLKEAAWHATSANNRSIGIEIANMARILPTAARSWRTGTPRTPTARPGSPFPADAPTAASTAPPEILRPARDEAVVGTIQNESLRQYDFTPQQYDSLIKLTATLCTIFPKIACDYPRDAAGKLVPRSSPTTSSRITKGFSAISTFRPTRPTPAPPSSGIE